MGTWKRLLQVTTLAVLASACGTSSSTSVNAPSARCAVTATAQPAAVGAPGGSGSIIVRTDRECAWEARSESDWLAIADSSGRGDGSMRYTAAGNPVVSERRGAVVVNGLRVEIGQAAAACAFGLDRSQQSVPATGGRIDVSVSAQAGCAWTARSDAPWISITSGAAGQGSGPVSLSVSANPVAQAQSSVVTIAGQPYLIEQAGAVIGGPVPPPPGPREPGCELTVSPLAASVGAEGGAIEVRVSASAATCSWTAVSGVPWIVMEGGVGETGSGSRRFAVAPNTTSESRVGSLGIAGAVVTVTQAAGSSPGPTPPPPPPPPPPTTATDTTATDADVHLLGVAHVGAIPRRGRCGRDCRHGVRGRLPMDGGIRRAVDHDPGRLGRDGIRARPDQRGGQPRHFAAHRDTDRRRLDRQHHAGGRGSATATRPRRRRRRAPTRSRRIRSA